MTQAQLAGRMCWLLLAIGLWSTAVARADEPSPTSEASLTRLIEELNSDQFEVRRRAAERLRALAKEPAAQPALAAALYRVLLVPETPYEVRVLCEPLLERLPPPELSGPPASLDEIDGLLVQADAASFGMRVGAAARLGWLASRDASAARIVAAKILGRLADPQLSSDAHERLTRVRQAAWIKWLASDPATWPAPSATEADVARWVATLAASASDKPAYEAAERELVDLLAYDKFVPSISAALQAELEKETLTPEANERVNRVYELSRPAMAAEIWEDHTHGAVQYLLVGVPQYPEEMPRATLFDRIDDNTAHCVSGNSLSGGDYPVGVAIPPTHSDPRFKKLGRMFQLVNLPTPRRRLLYDHQQLKIDETTRLIDVSQRTAAWLLKRNTCLTEREIEMLRQLEPNVVSRFVGPYLLAVDDQPKIEPDDFPTAGRASRHAMLCAILADIGTHEALPGMVEAARRGRLPAPNEELRYHIGWLSALAIAERDPWPGLDDWLASLIDVTQPLTITPEFAPDVGGTAAYTLLERHGVAIGEFGLVETNDPELRGLGMPACRFTSPAGRDAVLNWWQRHKARTKAAGA